MDALGSVVGAVCGFGLGSAPGFPFDAFPCFTYVSPSVLWAATLQPRLADRRSKSSCAWLLPSGYLVVSHPPLCIPGDTESPWVGASTVPCFSCASASIPERGGRTLPRAGQP